MRIYLLIFLQAVRTESEIPRIGSWESNQKATNLQQHSGFFDTLRGLFDGENGFNYEQLKNAAVNYIGSGNSTVIQGLRNMVLGEKTDAQLGDKVESVKDELSGQGKSALEEIMRFLGDTNNSDSFVHEMIKKVLGQQTSEDQSHLSRLFQGK
ncbi:unnamed protein product, partial [Mesorhabditis belari]|uniref:DUF148 domain-containing protein n=1 Tax=Mesorhabditis belari TaxID=2138241 RepID=A0AAF3JA45_9BILA